MPPRKPRVEVADQAYIEMARVDLAVYMAVVHKTDMPETMDGRALPAGPQKAMVDAFMDDSLGDTLIVMPRGAAKTTMAQGFIEWIIGVHSLSGDKDWADRLRILYLRSSAHLAYQVSNAVKATIEGSLVYQAVFPKVKPDPKKWSEHEWKVKGNVSIGPTFQAAGISSIPIGSRFEYCIPDDIADPENMATPAQRDKLKFTLTHGLMPMRAPGGRIIMLGTRWAWDDPPAWAMEWGWHTLYQKALIETEEGPQSYWPERFPVEDLLRMRTQNPRMFSQQYQNEVAPEEGIAFERWWFQKRFDDLPPEVAFRIEAWDLASSHGRKRSHSVGLAGVITPSCPLCNGAPWHIFVPHMFRGQKAYGYLKMAMRDVYDLMGGYSANHWMVVEKKSVGEALAGEGLDEVQFDDNGLVSSKGYPVHFVSALGEGQQQGVKEQAIMDVAEVCRQGRVHLPSDAFLRRRASNDWLPDFERDVFSYPDGQNDDAVFALSHLVMEVERVRQRQQRFLSTPQEPQRWPVAKGKAVRL